MNTASNQKATIEATTPLAQALQGGSSPSATTGDYVDSFGGIYSYEEIGHILDTSEPGERNASAIDHMALWYRMETAERALALASDAHVHLQHRFALLAAVADGLMLRVDQLREEKERVASQLAALAAGGTASEVAA